MKPFFSAFFRPLLSAAIAAAAPFLLSAEALDYNDPRNWVIRQESDEGAEKDESLFDLFYVYPTLVSSKERPLMDHLDPKVRAKTVNFAAAQTAAIFGKSARIYAPYVRQLEYGRCRREAADPERWAEGGMRQGVEDTVAAFRYYLDNCNRGRPFVLLGHSQGAIDLYLCLVKTPGISAERGFAAAYLPGLPRLTRAKFDADFRGRPLRLARNAGDPGVVAVWNTQNSDAKDSPFTVPGGVGINPLDWSTSADPVPAERNLGAWFYDYRTGTGAWRSRFCGARLDPATGALLVDLPSMSRHDAKGFMGRGVFHMNDIWFFAGNLRENALLRVRALRTAPAARKKEGRR